MLLNEFLKQHENVSEQSAEIKDLQILNLGRLLADVLMLFQKLVQQHRVHRLVPYLLVDDHGTSGNGFRIRVGQVIRSPRHVLVDRGADKSVPDVRRNPPGLTVPVPSYCALASET